MRTLLAVMVLSCVTLAGCLGGGDKAEPVTSAECLERGLILGNDTEGEPVCVEPPFVIEEFEDPGHFCVVNERRDRLHAPDLVGDPWEIGQYWDYSLQVDGTDHGTTRMVYYADQDVGAQLPLHYMVGTPTREEALTHALDSINPMIGRVHSVLYSPHESGDHANMFNFPLCDGSSWQTVFYGETFTLTAHKDNITVAGFDAPRPGYLIEGESPEGSTLSLTYSPDAQWFTLIDLDRADGFTVDMGLEEVGDGHTGDVYFLRGQKHESVDLTPSGPVLAAAETQTVARQDGGAGSYDTVAMRLSLIMRNGTGQTTLEVQAPNGTTMASITTDTADAIQALVTEVPYDAGDWVVGLQPAVVGESGGDAAVHASVKFVSIYDRSCTVGGDCLS